MENTITLTSISSYRDDTRPLLYLDVIYNGQLYKWQTFGISDKDLSEIIEEKTELIFEEIQSKLDYWENLEPKIKLVESVDFETGDIIEVEVPILKEEIVKPEIPDYYHVRAKSYPPIGDQLDALFKGVNSEEYIEMQAKINQIKTQNPKPNKGNQNKNN